MRTGLPNKRRRPGRQIEKPRRRYSAVRGYSCCDGRPEPSKRLTRFLPEVKNGSKRRACLRQASLPDVRTAPRIELLKRTALKGREYSSRLKDCQKSGDKKRQPALGT